MSQVDELKRELLDVDEKTQALEEVLRQRMEKFDERIAEIEKEKARFKEAHDLKKAKLVITRAELMEQINREEKETLWQRVQEKAGHQGEQHNAVGVVLDEYEVNSDSDDDEERVLLAEVIQAGQNESFRLAQAVVVAGEHRNLNKSTGDGPGVQYLGGTQALDTSHTHAVQPRETQIVGVSYQGPFNITVDTSELSKKKLGKMSLLRKRRMTKAFAFVYPDDKKILISVNSTIQYRLQLAERHIGITSLEGNHTVTGLEIIEGEEATRQIVLKIGGVDAGEFVEHIQSF